MLQITLSQESMTKELFLNVLVHEMVHQFQYETGQIVTHGRTFQAWAPHILTTTGLVLTEAYAS
jgi:predicted SprT family Zn-dependent metalloprotease